MNVTDTLRGNPNILRGTRVERRHLRHEVTSSTFYVGRSTGPTFKGRFIYSPKSAWGGSCRLWVVAHNAFFDVCFETNLQN